MDDCSLTGQPAAARVRLAVDGLQILMVASGPTLLIPAPVCPSAPNQSALSFEHQAVSCLSGLSTRGVSRGRTKAIHVRQSQAFQSMQVSQVLPEFRGPSAVQLLPRLESHRMFNLARGLGPITQSTPAPPRSCCLRSGKRSTTSLINGICCPHRLMSRPANTPSQIKNTAIRDRTHPARP
jgi:hypothetical protein